MLARAQAPTYHSWSYLPLLSLSMHFAARDLTIEMTQYQQRSYLGVSCCFISVLLLLLLEIMSGYHHLFFCCHLSDLRQMMTIVTRLRHLWK
jgi:hypothetical protein